MEPILAGMLYVAEASVIIMACLALAGIGFLRGFVEAVTKGSSLWWCARVVIKKTLSFAIGST
jgi:hypothetical protein